MEPRPPDLAASLTQLVAFLAGQRESILTNWRMACAQDPLLNRVVALNRAEFDNALPKLLPILQQRLLGHWEEDDVDQIAITHSLQRRHNARLVVETVRELNHLTQALYSALAHFQEVVPQADFRLFWQVQQHMTQMMAEVINRSIQTYDELQRAEAAGRAGVLQKALDQMTTLSLDRSDILRTSMHDLRGGISIIGGAASLLTLEGISEQDRSTYLDMLSRNITSVQAMLANLMDLSRLEAGQETLQIQPIDAAQLLNEVALSMQQMAEKRALALRINGPSSLPVETDPIKLQRIVQNLLLNALKYTATGFIEISWTKQDTRQWMVCIQDSGPGLPTPVAKQLTNQVKPVVNLADRATFEASAPAPGIPQATTEPDVHSSQLADELLPGEGIGLRIVKQFSELLRAKLEVETAQGQGTSFRLWLPARYPASS